MFDIDEFVTDCIQAAAENEPRPAIKEILEQAMRQPQQLAEALPVTHSEVVPLYTSGQLSILKAVWAPGMRFRSHNHLMWAAIGLYGGQENNTFYRRSGQGIVVSGGRELRTGDVALLGHDTIHAVQNPRQAFTGAIHVYGGDITARSGRSESEEDNGQEVDDDFERVRRYFAAFQAAAPATWTAGRHVECRARSGIGGHPYSATCTLATCTERCPRTFADRGLPRQPRNAATRQVTEAQPVLVWRSVDRERNSERDDSIGLFDQAGHVRRGDPVAAHANEPLLRHPTGDSAALSDVNRNLVFADLAQQFPRRRHPDAFDFIEYLRQQELGGVTGQHQADVVADLDRAVDGQVKRD